MTTVLHRRRRDVRESPIDLPSATGANAPLSPSTFKTPALQLRSGPASNAEASAGHLAQTFPHRTLIVIALLACRNWDGQAVLWRRQRAGCVRRVRAGWVLCAVEVQHQLAGLRQAVVRKRRVEKASRAVGFRLARSVANYEKQFGVLRALENGFETERFAVERELRCAGDVGLYLRAQYRRNGDVMRWVVGDPFGLHAVGFVGRVPL